MGEMADMAGVATSTIRRQMENNDVPRRELGVLTERAREKISRKMSEIKSGRPKSEKWKKSASRNRKGNTPSEATRKKISEALKGREFSEEHKRKLSEGRMGKDNPFYGCHHTEETRKRISENQRGENGYWYGKTGPIHPRWVGGAAKYYGPNWRYQKKKALKRDKHVCQRCGCLNGSDGRELDAHHKIPVREYYDDICNMYSFLNGYSRFVLKSIGHHVLIPEVVWEDANKLENLVSICRSCHQIIENPAKKN